MHFCFGATRSLFMWLGLVDLSFELDFLIDFVWFDEEIREKGIEMLRIVIYD